MSTAIRLLGAWLLVVPGLPAIAGEGPVPALDYEIRLDVPLTALEPDFCWFHPRAAAIPGAGRNGQPAVIMTLQKHLKVSDYYSGLWVMRTDDLGKTWTGPIEIPELGWRHEPDGVVLAVADVTPGYHPPSGMLLAIGCSIRYNPQGHQLADTARFSQTAYAVYDPRTDRWSRWRILDLPTDERFNLARNACSQWLVDPDGTLLVPLYFASSADEPASVTVARCRFDGQQLRYVEHGNEMALPVVRGLCEPSLIRYRDRYYLTIRNDERGYVAVSDDGLIYEPIRPWMFDDGTDLGSYNTQQHWLAHAEGLFLSYTRRGADNDHIFRHRAPLFIAQVDPQRLCVVRSTERVLIPEQGAAMGNFGAAAISPQESWVTVSEMMIGDEPHPRGAEGRTFVARVIWSRPNEEAEP